MNIEQAKAVAALDKIVVTDTVTLKGKRYFMVTDLTACHSITVDEAAPGKWLVEGMLRAKPRASAIQEATRVLLGRRKA